jgi:ribosomal protein S18 acetylase RimI-like enzyme
MTTTTSRSAVAAPTPDVKTPAVATSTARPRHSSKQQQLNRLNLRSPFISLEIKPATRLEELLAVIDLRAEVFANPALPLTIESKLRHIKHLLTRRAKGSVVLVASARDLLSPFSEEVVIGSLEFEEVVIGPFLHDSHICKLYVTEMCVKETFRRQGVASSLLKAVDGVATNTGAAYVCLFCERINQGASRLYDSLQYHEVGHSPSVEAFAEALGLSTTSKTYGFFYKQFALPSSAAGTKERTGGVGASAGGAAAPPSLTLSAAHTCVAGQQLHLWGKNHFSWW